MIKCLFTKAIQNKKLFLKKLEFSQKLKISKIHKISEILCLKHIKIVQNYLKSDIVCLLNIKTQSFLNNSCITENECVIAFLKLLWYIPFMFREALILKIGVVQIICCSQSVTVRHKKESRLNSF